MGANCRETHSQNLMLFTALVFVLTFFLPIVLPDKIFFTPLECVSTKQQHTLSYCQRLENENDFLHQKLLEVTGAPKKDKMLEERLKKHEEEIFSLKNHMDNCMVERSEVEKYKQAIKDN